MAFQFDKNAFKDAFRAWVQAHPRASEEEALAFCHARIPASHIVANYWLVEQSLQWFAWLKSRGAFDESTLAEGDGDDLPEASRTLN